MPGQDFPLYVDSQFKRPYILSAFVTLTEKQIPFNMRIVSLEDNENHHQDYSRLSLTRRVPTLTHGNFHLSESSAIAEYLEEPFPSPKFQAVCPIDVHQRARARQIQAWLRSEFIPIRSERPTDVIYFEPSDEPLSEQAKASASKLISAVDDLLDDGAVNLFDTWCIADTDLALMLNRLIFNGDNVPEKLVNYARHQWQRASVQLWVNQQRSR